MNGETLAGLLAGADQERPALTFPQGRRLSYAEVTSEVDRHQTALAGYGVGPGDRVALVLPNGEAAVLLFLAAATLATAAPLNPAYTEDEFRFYMDDTDAGAVIMLPGGPEGARRAAAGRTLLELRDGRLQPAAGCAPRAPAAARSPTPDDVALVLHTSGTTSRPKRVPLRHRNLIASVRNIVSTYELSPEDVSVCVMPLFHVHGLVASTLSALAAGGEVVVPARFNPLGFWPMAAGSGATWYSASPTIHELLLRRAGAGRDGRSRLRFIRSCSSALAAATEAAMEERFGAPVLNAYGMTEASHQMASNPLPPAERRAGTVGRGTGVEIGIMASEGQMAGAGEQGEVVIRGPNVVDGYEGNPEANAEAFSDGWFRTGDLGALDGDGFLTLAGRIKELINRGGEKIAPREVDEALESHPAVAEAVAFGVPHATWGEEVAAAVVLREPVSEKELLAHMRRSLADFKVPRKLHIVESIPRTSTGKVQRRQVAAEFQPPHRP